MATAFDSAFSGAPLPTYEEKPDDKDEVVETDEAEEVEAEETIDDASSIEKPAETAKPDDSKTAEPDKKITEVPQQALHATRQELKAVRAELQQLKQQQPKPPTSVHEDEDKAFHERMEPMLRLERQRFLDFSVEIAKSKPGREDYDEIYEFMNAECEADPTLAGPIINSKNPGETIYQLGKTRKELAAVGNDLSKYREHVTQAERQKLTVAEARIKALELENATLKNSQAKRDAIPRSTNAEQSGATRAEEFSGPTPLKQVFS
jgi:hypothetical protein